MAKMRVIVNGKLVEVEEGSKVHDLRVSIGAEDKDGFVRLSGSDAEEVADGEQVRKGQRFRSIPPITQGV